MYKNLERLKIFISLEELFINAEESAFIYLFTGWYYFKIFFDHFCSKRLTVKAIYMFRNTIMMSIKAVKIQWAVYDDGKTIYSYLLTLLGALIIL